MKVRVKQDKDEIIFVYPYKIRHKHICYRNKYYEH